MWSVRVFVIGSVFLVFFTIGLYSGVDLKSLHRSFLQSTGLFDLFHRPKGSVVDVEWRRTQDKEMMKWGQLGSEGPTGFPGPKGPPCPSKLQQKLEQLKLDGGAFLPMVPVLQWAPHATQEQYKRLSHYVGCMGWQNIKFDGCGLSDVTISHERPLCVATPLHPSVTKTGLLSCLASDVWYTEACEVMARKHLASILCLEGQSYEAKPAYALQGPQQIFKAYLSRGNVASVIPFHLTMAREDIKEVLSLLNSTANGVMFDNWRVPVKPEMWSKRGAPPSSACVRCAVVGNGGILRKTGHGSEIDKHDYVFRMNGAILQGFEEDVGKRTSFYFFSTNTMRNSLTAYRGSGFRKVPISEETRYVFIPDHDRDYFLVTAAAKGVLVEKGREKGINPSNLLGANLTAEKFKMMHPDFSRYLRNRLLPAPIMKSRSRNIYRPSTGAFALLTALYVCDEVSAFGFLTENYANFSDHYYDKTYKKTGFYANHNYNKEMKLWRRLHDIGAISLFMRNNTDVGLLHKS